MKSYIIKSKITKRTFLFYITKNRDVLSSPSPFGSTPNSTKFNEQIQ